MLFLTTLLLSLKISGILGTIFSTAYFSHNLFDLYSAYQTDMYYLNTMGLAQTSSDIVQLLKYSNIKIADILVYNNINYNDSIQNMYNLLDLKDYRDYLNLSGTDKRALALIFEDNIRLEGRMTARVLQDIVNSHAQQVASVESNFWNGIIDYGKPLAISLGLLIGSFALNSIGIPMVISIIG